MDYKKFSEDLMKKFLALACSLFILSSPVFCQSNEDDEDRFVINDSKMNEPGDQFINLGLMVTFPLNFGGSFPLYRDGNITTGGAGTLGYHRFITSNVALGLDVSFGYNPTIGENIFTYVPFVFCLTYQPGYKQFEFPITMGVGFASENYLNHTYFPGLIVKPQAGVFYRINPSWSFGVKGEFMYMPQWYNDSSKNDYGNFASTVIAARYHF